MVDDRQPLIVISGPTGVGKTRSAVHVARQFDGEIVNADSRYLYRGFDIGTAKPTPDELAAVPHHLIDILPPDGEMSLATFQALATATIREIQQRGHLPILVGGSVLYVNAIVEGWAIPEVPPDPEFRARSERQVVEDGGAALREELRRVDPVVWQRSGSNMRRVIRALEIYRATGIPMSALESRGEAPFRALELALTLERDALYQRLDRRIDAQVEHGLVDEVRSLLASGVSRDAPAMSSIGYRQLIGWLDGAGTLEEAVARIRADTRRYVRHQLTWLRRNPRKIEIDVANPDHDAQIIALVRAFLFGTTPL